MSNSLLYYVLSIVATEEILNFEPADRLIGSIVQPFEFDELMQFQEIFKYVLQLNKPHINLQIHLLNTKQQHKLNIRNQSENG